MTVTARRTRSYRFTVYAMMYYVEYILPVVRENIVLLISQIFKKLQNNNIIIQDLAKRKENNSTTLLILAFLYTVF